MTPIRGYSKALLRLALLLLTGMLSLPPTIYAQKSSISTDDPVTQTITFVTVENGQVMHVIPNWAIKWVKKNYKKYPGVRFQTTGEQVPGGENYVIAFSFSSDALNGFQPVTHTDTSTSTSPVSANGTVTDNQGNSWDYTMNGTVTTTTTTTTQENVPYTITSNTLYLTAYNGQGEMIGQRWHVYSTQSGGDPYSGLGYNLGNALAAIHAKSHLLQHTINDLVGKPKKKK